MEQGVYGALHPAMVKGVLQNVNDSSPDFITGES